MSSSSLNGGAHVPDGIIDLENCDLVGDGGGELLAKKQRLNVNYAVQKQQSAQAAQGGNRRKMPLVNRVL